MTTHKLFLKSTLVALLTVLLTGCDQSVAPVYNGKFIAFKGALRTVSEKDKPFNITITGTDVALKSNITLSGTAKEGKDYTISTQSVTIGKKYVATITVTPIDNNELDGNKEAIFTLESGGYPGGADGKEYTVKLLDDDCPIKTSATYAGSGKSKELNRNLPKWTLKMTPVPGKKNTFKVDTGWGLNYVSTLTGNEAHKGKFVYSGVLTINNDKTVSFKGDQKWASGGTGSYEPCEDRIKLTLKQSLFRTNNFTVDVVWAGNRD